MKRAAAVGVVLALAAAGLTGSASATAGTSRPAGCAAGLGDRVHPELGTPGVRIGSYATSLTFAPGLRHFSARTDITATVTSTRPLRCLALDASRLRLRGASVDGQPVRTVMQGEKLFVLPQRPTPRGAVLHVQVRSDTTVPDLHHLGRNDLPPGIFGDGHWVQVLAQPSLAHSVVPMADHPAQKAPWTVTLTVPRGLAGVSNGTLVSHTRAGAHERYTYRTGSPLATHVLQVTVGPLRLVEQGSVAGVRIRH